MISLIKRIINIRDLRYKQAIRTSYISFLAQAVYLIISVISVPLILNALGPERYGLWMTLSSTLLFITFTDFGMGIGMQNLMSYAKAHNDRDTVRKSLTTTLAFGFISVIILCFLSQFILPLFDMTTLFKYQDKNIAKEILPATQAVLLVLVIGILSGVVQRAFESFQEGYYPKIILIFSRLISLGLLYWAIITHQSIFVIIFALNGLPNLILFLGIFYFYKRYPFLYFKIADIDWKTFKKILKTGIVGLGASISIYLVSSISPFIISSTYGLHESSRYMLLMKLLNFAFIFFNIIFLPFWPAVADAYSKRDLTWLNSLHRRVTSIIIWGGIPIFAILLLTSKWLIFQWGRNVDILPSFPLILWTVIFTFLSVWNTVTCVFLNGMSIFKSQAIFGTAIALLSLLVAFFIKDYTNPTGIVFIITMGMLIRCIYLHLELNKIIEIHENMTSIERSK